MIDWLRRLGRFNAVEDFADNNLPVAAITEPPNVSGSKNLKGLVARKLIMTKILGDTRYQVVEKLKILRPIARQKTVPPGGCACVRQLLRL